MLKDYPKSIVTKDGVAVQLRLLARGDLDGLRDLFTEIPEDERWFLRDNLSDRESLVRWFENLDYRKCLPIVAIKETNGQIIGNLRLYRSASGCARHVAHIRIMVHPAYRAQKIGSWMIRDCAQMATDLGIERIIAEFVSGVEDLALMAAKRLDFHQEAVLKEYVKDPDGVYHDLIIMSKNLSTEWGDF